MLIDIHCHLDQCYFKDDLDKVIDNAKKANVKVILTAGVNPETNRKTLEIAEKYAIVKASLGIYPIQTLQKEIEAGSYPLKENKFNIDEEIKFIENNKNKIMAIGEVGLDYSQKEDPKKQKELFEKLINATEKLNKPIIVHSRKAEQDCIDILQSSKLKKIIMHCFTGKKNLVKKIIDSSAVDFIAMDIKAPLDKYHKVVNAKISKEKIKKSIDLVKKAGKTGIDYEFRLTVVPKLHTKKDIKNIGKLLKGSKKIALQQFDNKNTYDSSFRKIKPFSKQEIYEFSKILEPYVKEVEVRVYSGVLKT